MARVSDDKPDTHRFRLADDDVLDFVADALPLLDELVPVFDDEESATHSRTPYGILNWFLIFFLFYFFICLVLFNFISLNWELRTKIEGEQKLKTDAGPLHQPWSTNHRSIMTSRFQNWTVHFCVCLWFVWINYWKIEHEYICKLFDSRKLLIVFYIWIFQRLLFRLIVFWFCFCVVRIRGY